MQVSIQGARTRCDRAGENCAGNAQMIRSMVSTSPLPVALAVQTTAAYYNENRRNHYRWRRLGRCYRLLSNGVGRCIELQKLASIKTIDRRVAADIAVGLAQHPVDQPAVNTLTDSLFDAPLVRSKR